MILATSSSHFVTSKASGSLVMSKGREKTKNIPFLLSHNILLIPRLPIASLAAKWPPLTARIPIGTFAMQASCVPVYV